MINEQADADFMPVFVFTERQGSAHQIGTALAERIVEPLNMGRFTSFFEAFYWLRGLNILFRGSVLFAP